MATLNTHQDRFSLWLPVELEAMEKSGEGQGEDQREYFINGILSTEHEDEDGETVVQKGMDLSYFLAHGKLTYGHPASIHNVCGEPISATPTVVEGKQATALKGRLFTTGARGRLGRSVVETAEMMKASGARTGLGLSVEGVVLGRDPKDAKRVVKSKVYTAAIDPSPKNHHSWFETMAASMNTALFQAGFASHEEWAAAGFPPVAPPSQPSLTPSAAAVSTATLDPRLLKGISPEDLLALRAAKRFPGLSWQAATRIAGDVIRAHGAQR
jgi:hypothetical protein